MTREERHIERCFDLAKEGFPEVSPNPMVGAVVVYNDTIIGEGYHQKYGETHAEVNAINSVKDKSFLKDSTLYVNLEPCSHYGKTPPCSELIIQSGIRKVVISDKDPNPKVAGNGVQMLRNNGVDVQEGLKRQEARKLNVRFYTFHRLGRPYIILKYAMSADGFMADRQYHSKWISNEYSRLLVHQWRGEEQAILAGTKTVEKDNPTLTNRHTSYGNPLRLVIDKMGRLSPDLNIFNTDADTVVYTSISIPEGKRTEFIRIDFRGNVLQQIMLDLYKRNVLSIIVEGGANTIQSFIDNDLWDEARLFVAPKNMFEGLKAPKISDKINIETDIMGDKLIEITNTRYEKIILQG